MGTGYRQWRRLVAFSGVLLVVMTLLVFGVVRLSHAQRQPIYEPLSDLLPGNQLPAGADCFWYPYQYRDTVSCYLKTAPKRVYLAYDTKRQVISQTSMFIDEETVGSLIQAWGTPTGIRQLGWSIQVFWGNRYVYVRSDPFEPGNYLGYVTYALEPDETTPWTGFKNSH
ncbi:MAG: hypothetical protein IT324_09660 [Anaerolineae bacterium]|nr:hypothetical protein [Anaerolineae bacterium]